MENKNLLKINPQIEKKKIIKFIQKNVEQLNKDGVVIGLSGGLDSSTCAYLLVEALGKKNVLGLILPERDSAKINMEHARMVAKNLGIKTIEIDISKVLEKMGVYKVGPKELKTKKDIEDFRRLHKRLNKTLGDYPIFKRLATGYGMEKLPILLRLFSKKLHKVSAFIFTKIRTRMLYLYFYAYQHNYALIGTLDKSEFSVGLFDVYGDGACALSILQHLYKSQIKELAIGIGIPQEITQKPSSGDAYGNTPWEESLGMTYKKLDQILLGIEKGYSKNKLTKIADADAIESVKKGKKVSELVRSLPITLD